MINYIHCRDCGQDLIDTRNGFCWDCRELNSIEARKRWCIAPMHKSNYMLITSKDMLAGINNKGGITK